MNREKEQELIKKYEEESGNIVKNGIIFDSSGNEVCEYDIQVIINFLENVLCEYDCNHTNHRDIEALLQNL